MASATSDSATYGDTAAPESASSTDGMTRSMLAMMLFNQAKGEHDALKAAGEAADPDGKLLKAFHERWAVQCHNFAVDHGGVYIKAAQFIASLQGGAGEAGVPREYVEALRPLTDRVPPRPFEAVAPVAEEEFGKPLSELLAFIDQTPLAAASLAQTMAAPSGYDFSWLLQDLQKYVTSELDFTTEAKNAMAAADALKPLAPWVLVPRVIPELSKTRVMATEFVEGLTRLDRPAELAALGLDRYEIGLLVSAAFSELYFIHGLVHGDPHSGNVYTRPLPGGSKAVASSKEGGGGGGGGGKRGGFRGGGGAVPAQLVVLDHGLYHKLTDADRIGMCDLVLACATPWPSRTRVNKLAKRFAGGLAPLFPALISPAFAFSTGLSLQQLRAASEGRLPAGTTLDDVWQTLVEMHNGESDVLGLLHSMGYVRGLHNACSLPEKDRVLALADAAVRAKHADSVSVSSKGGKKKEGGLALSRRLTRWRVEALFTLLALLGALVRLCDVLAALLLRVLAVLSFGLVGGGRRVSPS